MTKDDLIEAFEDDIDLALEKGLDLVSIEAALKAALKNVTDELAGLADDALRHKEVREMRKGEKRSLTVSCPFCLAKRGEKCQARNYNGTSSGTRAHRERLERVRSKVGRAVKKAGPAHRVSRIAGARGHSALTHRSRQ